MTDAIEYPPTAPCGGCGAKVGEEHGACDWERCPKCGGQLIACDCIYEFCLGADVDLETAYPSIYNLGPTPAMYTKWETENAGKWVKHNGHYPGTLLAVEQGWYSRWGAIREGRPNGGPWIICSKSCPGAKPDLNMAAMRGTWDVEKQRLVLR